MFKNYVTIALRTLRRSKEYSLINIFGLSISIASCLLLFAVLRFETSFDTYHTNAKSIYRVVMNFKYPEGDLHTSGVPAPAPDAFRTDFPQLVHQATLFSVSNMPVAVEQDGVVKHFKEEHGAVYVEAELFDMLDFNWLHGTPKTSLNDPNTAVLDEETAKKFFGSWQNAIGKSFVIEETRLIKITGILKALPDNTDFPLHIVISFNTRKELNKDWGDVTSRRQYYVQLPEQMTPDQMSNLLPAFFKKHNKDDESIASFSLQPLTEIHFDERYGNLNGRTIATSTLLSFGLIALFLLVTASINFVNLAIAQVIRKSKEVGVRKVLGSERSQLIVQFLGETMIMLVIAAVISVVLAQAVLPLLQPILYLPRYFNIVGSADSFVFLGGIVVVLTFLAGAYPAFVMAGFKPVAALKNKINTSAMGGVSLRKGLVVLQFVIAQVLVIVTIVVFLQMNFFKTTPKGFNSESVIYFPLPKDSNIVSRMNGFKEALLQKGGVAGATFNYTTPSSRNNNTTSFKFEGSVKEEPFEVNLKFGDVDYFKTFQLQLVGGRIYQQSDTAREYVVNEKLLKKLGISTQDALGKTLDINGAKLPIVGVIRDFHNLSFHNEITPIAITSGKRHYEMMSVKLEPGKQKEAIENLASLYTSFFPASSFDYQFLEDYMAKNYKQEERLASMTIIFSGISIFISCLGLYGLISFLTVQRTKEVGIRKLLGASLGHILFSFYKEFVILVSLAGLVAVPLAAYAMNQWLTRFVYHVDLMVWVFVVAVAGTLVLALATLSFQSVKAALANPVDSLRTE